MRWVLPNCAETVRENFVHLALCGCCVEIGIALHHRVRPVPHDFHQSREISSGLNPPRSKGVSKIMKTHIIQLSPDPSLVKETSEPSEWYGLSEAVSIPEEQVLGSSFAQLGAVRVASGLNGITRGLPFLVICPGRTTWRALTWTIGFRMATSSP